MGKIEMSKCYMCDAEGTTREHVPPDCFFPKGYRENLITVPSCPDHNTKNSKDVEYVRNVIVGYIATNGLARTHFQNKVIRSFERSPKLFTQTFKDAQPIIVNGQETGVFTFDLARFKLVMKAIAYAIYFKSFGQIYGGNWEIFSSSLVSPEALLQGQPDGWEGIRQMLHRLNLTELTMAQPEVFRCGIQQWDEVRLIYGFLFYGGFVVYAIGTSSSHDAV